MRHSVCIVSNEVFPLQMGGIGRLTYNFAVANARSREPADIHFLLPAGLRVHADVLETVFNGLAEFHFCPETLHDLRQLGRLIMNGNSKESLDQHLIESLKYYAGLLDAQAELGRAFEFVEFPDFGGWGAAAIAAKRAGVAFNSTQFVVRLHSTFSLISDHEPFAHELSDWTAGMCDLEYQALRDSDLVIAHLPSIAEMNARRFPDPEAWQKKVRVEFPPIVLSEIEREASANRPPDCPPPKDFIFTARLQPFKRPDLFIRAAVCFLDRHENSGSCFRISSYGWDIAYIAWLKSLVPFRHRRSILFLENVPAEERIRLMLESIVVIPSDFESCCLLAYEGRLLGTPLILNRRCKAFGSEPERWRDGRDCLFFDGEFISLAKTMESALSWTPYPADVPKATTPYWSGGSPNETIGERRPAGPMGMALLVFGHANLDELGRRLQDLEVQPDMNEIHLLLPRETVAAANASLRLWRNAGITVWATSWPEPTATDIQHAIDHVQADLVAFLPADVKVERQLWSLARTALAAVPEAAIYTSHGRTADGRHHLNYGDAPTVALLADRIAHRASVFRTTAVRAAGLRDAAGERWFEDLCARMVSAGNAVLVAPLVLAQEIDALRCSRIPASRFYGTLRDEAGRRFGTAYRQGSAGSCTKDSMRVAKDDVVAPLAPRRAGRSRSAWLPQAALNYERAVLKSTFEDAASDYRHLEIELSGLSLGRFSLPLLTFKLGESRGRGQLEFRDAGNARQFFKVWPPATSDRWGPVAVFKVNGSEQENEFFNTLQETELQRLIMLIELLPEFIAGFELPGLDQVQWTNCAGRLAANTGNLGSNQAAGRTKAVVASR